MFIRIWRQWRRFIVEAVRRNALRGGKRARLSSFRPRLEALEERAVPATIGDVFYIEMENHNLTPSVVVGGGTFPIQQLLRNAAAPYLNSLMTPGNPNAAQSAYASNYLSVGAMVHPSEPNYVWQEGGNNFGVNNDLDPYTNNGSTNQNLNNTVKLIAATGNNPASLSALLQAHFGTAGWKSYQEDMEFTNLSVPTISATGALPLGVTNPYNGSNQFNFSPKHDGALFFTATNGGTLSGPGPADGTNTEAQFYAPLAQLATDLTNNTVAKYTLISPDNFNDMHSGLTAGYTYHNFLYTGDQAAVAQGDNFLSIIIPQIMASQAYKNNGAIVIWIDESEGTDSDDAYHTLTEIVISPLAKGNAYASGVEMNHSSDIKTMEEIFQLGSLLNNPIPASETYGGATSQTVAGANDLSDLFIAGTIPTSVPEPMGVAWIGFGALVLMARRPNRVKGVTTQYGVL